jgi:hypothetical protein
MKKRNEKERKEIEREREIGEREERESFTAKSKGSVTAICVE